ncbi:universal stress protein [Oxalobacter vibrioformis]|uniref:Universal stress protein n=1 Tax=Oxalobacter vibrioformis TaxID=933080 RepID=A0A9E9M224_9BURK|nr:universal stress protein [Oxalobacter vibrioformis]WAW11063.1 universal stress protein [Oxalobacter vibrioformis]
MYKTILVPTDGTALSDKAISAAIQYASIHKGCKIIGMTVAEPLPLTQLETFTKSQESDYLSREHKIAEERVNRIAEQAKAAGVPFDTVILQSSKPHEEIVHAAAKYDCDCIFMASNGRKGLNKLFIGSETQKVLATTSIPVLVYR